MIGTWLHWALFGGDFPGDILIPRLYAIHILLFPGIMLALIGVHLAMVWFQKHTQFPGPGRTEKNVVGVRVMPVFALKSGAFFAMTLGILGLMGGLLQINPIWQLGPYKPSQVSAGSQPDFYLMWTDGLIRIWPAWEIYIGNHTIPAAVAVALMMGLVFIVLIVYPFIEAEGDRRPRPPQSVAAAARCPGAHSNRCNGDRVLHRADIQRDERHHRLQVPSLAQRDDLDRAHRHGGAAGDRLLHHLSLVYRVCSAATARCSSTASRPASSSGCRTGAYIELHQPLGPLDGDGHPIPLEYQGAALPKRLNKLGSGRSAGQRQLPATPIPPPSTSCSLRPNTPQNARRSPHYANTKRTATADPMAHQTVIETVRPTHRKKGIDSTALPDSRRAIPRLCTPNCTTSPATATRIASATTIYRCAMPKDLSYSADSSGRSGWSNNESRSSLKRGTNGLAP